MQSTKTHWVYSVSIAGWTLPARKSKKSWSFSPLETNAQVSAGMPVVETHSIEGRRGQENSETDHRESVY